VTTTEALREEAREALAAAYLHLIETTTEATK
jgi:hypothetical protein